VLAGIRNSRAGRCPEKTSGRAFLKVAAEPRQSAFNIFQGIGVTEAQVSFRLPAEVNPRRNAHVRLFQTA
jgi:hypothetical protein